MKTINYKRLPKGLTLNTGFNVLKTGEKVYILYCAAYSGECDQLWVTTPKEYEEYKDVIIDGITTCKAYELFALENKPMAIFKN